MDNYKELIKVILASDELPEIDSFDDGFGRTKVYGITADGWTLRVWNSSNNTREIPFSEALKEISTALLDDESDGHIICGFHLDEILWEVIEE